MKATFVATVAAVLVAYGSATKIVCPPVNGEDVTLLPNPHDCKTYYSCNEGIPHLMYCYVGLEFNPIERVCDWPEHAGCHATVPKPPEQPDGSSRPNRTGSSKVPLPNNGLGLPDLQPRPDAPPRPDLPPHPDAPPRPPKPACPAEPPNAAEPPRPSKPPRPTELPPLTEPRPTPSSRPTKLPRPTLPPKPATTTRRRPIWPIWPIWHLPAIGHAGSQDNTNFVENDVDGVDDLV